MYTLFYISMKFSIIPKITIKETRYDKEKCPLKDLDLRCYKLNNKVNPFDREKNSQKFKVVYFLIWGTSISVLIKLNKIENTYEKLCD